MKTFARDACRVEIIERLRSVNADGARRWGTMTPHQMVCHCADACRMALGEVTPREISTGATRHVIKWVALYAPMRWPAGVQTVAEFDQRTVGPPSSAFADDVATLTRLLGAIQGRAGGAGWPRHPIFGRMTERAWLRWAYLHMDHHLRQFGA
jgi:Protein of unknown function (DUF1569)